MIITCPHCRHEQRFDIRKYTAGVHAQKCAKCSEGFNILLSIHLEGVFCKNDDDHHLVTSQLSGYMHCTKCDYKCIPENQFFRRSKS